MNLNFGITARHVFAFAACGMPLLLALTSPAANANDARIPTLAELRLLPPYCPNTQIISKHYGRQQAPANYDAQTKPYVDLYGADFWHLHHYCFGLVYVVRNYREFDRRNRDRILRESIGEFSYVLKGISPGSILRPELHVKRGQSLVLMGRSGEAVADFRKAITLKPDYSPAYASLSDYYKETGKKTLALTTLEEGLTQSPGDPSLLRRYANLGGKKTFDLPPVAEPAAIPVPPQEQPAKLAEPATESDKPSPSTEQTQPIQPLGNSTNPYCRFCP